MAKASDNIDKYLAINIGNREMVVDENGQALSAFKHEITNIGQKPIKNIQWVGVYVNNRKVIYSQDMQINLETPLILIYKFRLFNWLKMHVKSL